MKILTIIGGLIMDDTFREAMLKDPVGTALDYGFQLTNHQAETLKAMIAAVKTDELDRMCKELQVKWCQHPPCPIGFAYSKVYPMKKRAA